MLRDELLKKVRLIEITTRKVMNDVMTGRYKSHFKGQGVQFSEHRQYVPGDDVRHIDWKVSARTRDPLIKKFEEERELSVLLIVDVSHSGAFGSTRATKAEVAAEVAGMLAHAAVHTGDKIGVLLFAGEVEKIIPLRKGRSHIQRIIRDVLSFQASSSGTNLATALESAGRVLKHSGVVFVLSDFITPDFSVALRRIARRNDVVAIRIGDQREQLVPPSGQLPVIDPETGVEIHVDTDSHAFRQWFEGWMRERERTLSDLFRKARVEELRILTQEDHGDAVVRYFRARARFGRGLPNPSKKGVISSLFWAGLLLYSGVLFGAQGWAEESRPAVSSSPSAPAADPYADLPVVDVDWLNKPDGALRVGDRREIRLSGFDFRDGMTLSPLPGGPSWLDQGYIIIDPRIGLKDGAAVAIIAPLRQGGGNLEPMLVLDSGGTPVARTSPWRITGVTSNLKPEESSPQAQPSAAPARGPLALSLPAWVWVLILVLAGGLLAVGVTWGVRRWKQWRQSRSKPVQEKAPPPKAEDVEALDALGNIKNADWQTPAKRKILYFSMSDAIKRYAGRRWEFDAQESTTDEFIEGLRRSSGEPENRITEMSAVFEKLDIVKFADHVPEPDEGLELIARLEKFVRTTRRPPAAVNSDASSVGGAGKEVASAP